jgi:hypothetical protein
VAVENVFIVAFLSSASARGQWKSAFPLAVILEPPVKRAFAFASHLYFHLLPSRRYICDSILSLFFYDDIKKLN